ncbi:hypothetical protein C8J56DRAFT_1046922 [Mycena floridula]|nr:hypothetical protein C8J56DRAFT_1046922 [Mycena floridula]
MNRVTHASEMTIFTDIELPVDETMPSPFGFTGPDSETYEFAPNFTIRISNKALCKCIDHFVLEVVESNTDGSYKRVNPHPRLCIISEGGRTFPNIAHDRLPSPRGDTFLVQLCNRVTS